MIDEAALLDDLQARAFAPSSGPPAVGLEVEMLPIRDSRAVPLAELIDAIEPFIALDELVETTRPGAPRSFNYGSISLTFEPGGQIEVVSPPRGRLGDALEDVRKLEGLLDRVFLWRGIHCAQVGINPWQDAAEIPLQTPLPRYQAMQTYFSRIGPDGIRMMRVCCALQVNVDTGEPTQVARRWRLANLMSPILTGMFANSPLAAGRVTGWKSTRASIWFSVDPSRTGFLLDADGPAEYLRFALDAGLMLWRTPDGYVPGVPGYSFRHWLESGNGDGPTLDDWHYHLTTLFPQVRPRGYFELRSIDTPPRQWRAVPVAVAAALLSDDAACEAGIALLEPHVPHLHELARASACEGLAYPPAGRLARQLMDLARQSFSRRPDGWIAAEIAADVDAFADAYTTRGRCPADDLISPEGAQRWVS